LCGGRRQPIEGPPGAVPGQVDRTFGRKVGYGGEIKAEAFRGKKLTKSTNYYICLMNDDQIANFRSFNRFYTAVIGLLDKHYLNSGFSLSEGRILYEIYHSTGGITARYLSVKLNLDKSYLSRMLDQFEKKKLVEKKRSDEDKRSFHLFLSRSGKLAFEKLNVASQRQAVHLLQPLKNAEVRQLIDHMEGIRQILTNANM
jgi:DNA-binding MarR family transcriptional regulator